MKNQGFTLIELMVVTLVTLAVSSALFVTFVDTVTHDRTVKGLNDSEKGAREQLDTLVDHLRNAQQYQPSANAAYAVVSAATATSVTYFVDAAGNTVRYYLSGTDFRRDDTAIGGADSVVFREVTSLEFKYYKATGDSYYTAIAPTTDVHAPTAAELPLLTQVDVLIEVSVDGQPRTMFSQVRLRNSPRKERL